MFHLNCDISFRLLLWGGRKCRPPSMLITIAVHMLKALTVTMIDPVDCACGGGNSERASGSHCHTPHVDSAVLAFGHDCLHHITSLVALDLLRTLGSGAREARIVHETHLPSPMSPGANEQGNDSLDLKP